MAAKRTRPKYGPNTTAVLRLAQKLRPSKRGGVIHLQAGKSGSISVARKPGVLTVRVHKARVKSRWKRVILLHIDNGW